MTDETKPAKPARPLTPNQLQAAVLLGNGMSRERTAELVGVSEAGVSKWKRNPLFQAEVQRRAVATTDGLQELVQQAKRSLAAGVDKAISTLLEAMQATDANNDPRWPVRVQAAEAMLKTAGIAAVDRASGESGKAAAAAVVIISTEDAHRAREIAQTVEAEIIDQEEDD